MRCSVSVWAKKNGRYGEFSFQVQDPRRSCGVLQQSIPVPFSTRELSSAGCLSGTLPSSISHADRQSKSWFASGNSITSRIFRTFFWGSPGQVLLCLKSGHHGRLSRTHGPDVYFGFWQLRILSAHETSSHEDSASANHFRRAARLQMPRRRGIIKRQAGTAAAY